MSEETNEAGFCTRCGFAIASFAGLVECPSCGSTGIPCGNSGQRTVSVNVHELRCLCIWAERFAGQVDAARSEADEPILPVVYAIARRLARQLPPEDPPLTFSGELQEIGDMGISVDHNLPGLAKVKTRLPS